MNKIKWTSLLIALIYVALGVLFIVRPLNVESALCYVLAIAIAIFGLLYIGSYFVASSSSDGDAGNGFAIGILMIMMAVFVVAKQDLIITLVPFLFGVMILVSGLFTLQTAIRVRRMGFPMRVPLITGLVVMAFGLFVMLFPLESGETLFILIGCGLLATGVSRIVEEIAVHTMHRRDEHARERARDMGPSITTYEADDEVSPEESLPAAEAVENADAGAIPAEAASTVTEAEAAPGKADDSAPAN